MHPRSLVSSDCMVEFSWGVVQSHVSPSVQGLTCAVWVSCSIAFAFGDTILPEVQATVGGNAKKEMYKGVSCGYSILLSSYMIVAIAGACIVL